jgi:hypothetical protein
LLIERCYRQSSGQASINNQQFGTGSASLREKEDSMCPACISSAALVAGSVMSTGGIAALAVKLGFSKKNRGKKTEQKNDSNNVTERRNDDGDNERNHR